MQFNKNLSPVFGSHMVCYFNFWVEAVAVVGIVSALMQVDRIDGSINLHYCTYNTSPYINYIAHLGCANVIYDYSKGFVTNL